MTDKAKGVANEAAGNVKQGFGKAIGNKQMEIEGTIQERKGEAQQQKQFEFLEEHPVIRPLSDYSLESLSQFRKDRH